MGTWAGTGGALACGIVSDVHSTSPSHGSNSGAHGEPYSKHTHTLVATFKHSCTHDSRNEPHAPPPPTRPKLVVKRVSQPTWGPSSELVVKRDNAFQPRAFTTNLGRVWGGVKYSLRKCAQRTTRFGPVDWTRAPPPGPQSRPRAGAASSTCDSLDSVAWSVVL